MNERIIIGVSGGIDSTLAALLLKEQGWNVRAVHIVTTGFENGEDLTRLRRLEEDFSIPLTCVDCRRRFEKTVIDPFLAAYRRGETPNPCVYCNETLKFRVLVETADALGIKYIATGHYARIVNDGVRSSIARTDSIKDQTYALYRLPTEWLPRIIFPLADMSGKTAVREKLADLFGKGISAARESQDICFLGDRSLESFLTSRLLPQERFPGCMLDENGRVLGEHKGLIYYTEGQRKGLGLSRGPWFVIRRDFSSGNMYLKHGSEGRVSTVLFDRAVWQQKVLRGERYSVQYCYRFPPVESRLTEDNGYYGTVSLITPCKGVSIGQSIVFYKEGILLGGGVITNVLGKEERL